MLMAKDLRSRGLLPKGTLTGSQISAIFHNLVEQRNEHACRWHDLIKKLEHEYPELTSTYLSLIHI